MIDQSDGLTQPIHRQQRFAFLKSGTCAETNGLALKMLFRTCEVNVFKSFHLLESYFWTTADLVIKRANYGRYNLQVAGSR